MEVEHFVLVSLLKISFKDFEDDSLKSTLKKLLCETTSLMVSLLLDILTAFVEDLSNHLTDGGVTNEKTSTSTYRGL